MTPYQAPPEYIPLSTVYKNGNHLTRDAYRQLRMQLRVGDFYATRVMRDAVIKIRCTRRDVSELHGFICDPTSFRRLGLTMLLVKDDDPCSDDILSRHLKQASLVTGWKKDAEGIMRPVYQTQSVVLSVANGSTIQFVNNEDDSHDTEWVGLNENPPYSEEHA